jgi:hypothetical protein
LISGYWPLKKGLFVHLKDSSDIDITQVLGVPEPQDWHAGSVTAIETLWKGYRCRSRLEARWCCFLDSMGIRFEYEPEGYQLVNGERYLPDFLLSHIDLLAEVKPYIRNQGMDPFRKAKEFVRAGMRPEILLLKGAPDFRLYSMFRKINLVDGPAYEISNTSLDIYSGRPRWYFKEKRLYENASPGEFETEDQFSSEYKEAVYAARGHRFITVEPGSDRLLLDWLEQEEQVVNRGSSDA